MNLVTSLYNLLQHPENHLQKFQTVVRIIWWKVNALFFHFPLYYPLTSSLVCICRPESSYASLVVYCHRPEPEVSALIEHFVTSGDVVIDVGANIGAISLLAASKRPKQVFAFEPDSRVYPYLVENIHINKLENVIRTYPIALSNKNGRVTFTHSGTTETSHITHSSEAGKSVKTQTLDTFFIEQKLKRVQLAKIDVEGAEMMVLQGAKKVLREQRIECLSLELNAGNYQYETSHKEIIDFLQSSGYKILLFSQGKFTKMEDFPSQDETINLIAVKDFKTQQKVQKAWNSYVAQSHL